MNKQQFDNFYTPDYPNYFRMVSDIGSTLNGRKDRFDKADLLEQGLQQSTSSRLTWVDDIGCDMIDQRNKIKYEVKSQANSLYTKKGNKKSKTSKIKLKNTLQQGEAKKLDVTSDYLIIIDTAAMAMAIISYEQVVNEFTNELKDGFDCQIPLDRLCFLHEPELNASTMNESMLSYAQQKQQMQKRYVESYFNK